MKNYLKLIRIKQWVKNFFVFIPIFFSGNVFHLDLIFHSFLAFTIFSLTASSIYIINDYRDIDSDKNHPTKKYRPLASGAISKRIGIILCISLMLISITLLILFSNWQTFIVIGSYFVFNILYTYGLKHIAILDVIIISMGFVLRVFAGGTMTGIEISQWTILLTFMLALVLALGKRRGELLNDLILDKTRKSLQGYNLEFTNVSLIISCVIVLVSYIMFTISDDVQRRMQSQIFYTFVFVLLGVLRYLQQTFVFNLTESPTKLIYKDLFLQVTILGWILSVLILIYFN